MIYPPNQITYKFQHKSEYIEIQHILFSLGYHWSGSRIQKIIDIVDSEAIHVDLIDKTITHWLHLDDQYTINLLTREKFLDKINYNDLL
jgi:hypothetical protein